MPGGRPFATLTSKGPVTLPKAIRDRLDLDAGSVLDVELQADDTITVRAAKSGAPDARRLRGLLRMPQPRPLSVERMDDAVARHLQERHRGVSAKARPRRR